MTLADSLRDALARRAPVEVRDRCGPFLRLTPAARDAGTWVLSLMDYNGEVYARDVIRSPETFNLSEDSGLLGYIDDESGERRAVSLPWRGTLVPLRGVPE